MKMQNFSLIPFRYSEQCRDILVSGSIRRDKSLLSIWFHLAGGGAIDLPERLGYSRQRKEELWKNTCFELFFARPDAPNYWEVNLAPSGHWDVYRFEGYRQGMLREERIDMLSSRIFLQDGCLTLHCNLYLDNLRFENYPLVVGVSAVLCHKVNQLSYWALCHGDERADFHNPDTFTLTL